MSLHAKILRRQRNRNIETSVDALCQELLDTGNVSPSDFDKLKPLMRHYAKEAHPFTACVRDNSKRWGVELAKKRCAVLKDLIRGRKDWRGKNNPKDVGVNPAIYASEFEDAIFWANTLLEDNSAEEDIPLSAEEGNSAETRAVFQIEPGIGWSKNDDNGVVYWRAVDDENLQMTISTPDGRESTKLPISGNASLQHVHAIITSSVDTEPIKLADDQEIDLQEFLSSSDGDIELSANGRIWKPVLRTGIWKVGPRSTKEKTVPLEVTLDGEAGVSKISLRKLARAFKAGAKQHVTVPLSHDNGVLENTGYVRDVRVVPDGEGGGRLDVEIEFTDPEVAKRAHEGSIPDVSAGIKHLYQRKEDGKTFDQILDHVCLTPTPWINGLPAFGAKLAEELGVDADRMIMLSQDPKKPYGDVTYADPGYQSDGKKRYPLDSEDHCQAAWKYINKQANAAKYSADQLAKIKVKIKAALAKYGVKTSASEEAAGDPGEGVSGATGASASGAHNPDHLGGDGMPDGQDALLEELGYDSMEDLKADLSRSKETSKEVKELRVDALADGWSKAGVPAAVIEEAKGLALADTGAHVLNLSDDEGGEVNLSATDIVERIVAKVPRVDLSEPAAPKEPPPLDGDDKDKGTIEERVELSERFLAGETITLEQLRAERTNGKGQDGDS